MTATSDLLAEVRTAGQDEEWYPTTPEMIEAVKAHLPADAESIMDIGAGDGRVLAALASKCDRAILYAIEKSTVLVQAQPDNVIPVGTEFFEQNLACLPTDYIFCNPPYSQFAAWATRIIEMGHAKRAYLVIPKRWETSAEIKAALAKRGAKARTIHEGDFLDADRRSRATVHVVEIRYPLDDRRHSYQEIPKDPFDIWFDQNISTFDAAEGEAEDEPTASDLARKYQQATIADMVTAYREEYARLEGNYRAIFKLDRAILSELGVSKENVREGIKEKMKGLKTKYWQILFSRLDAPTSRLCTETRRRFLDKLTGNTSIGFTATNAYAVVLWAIKNANRYYDEQLVTLFKELSTFEGVSNYKSNTKTWERDVWRYRSQDHSHYALDYRFVVSRYSAMKRPGEYGDWDYPGGLHRGCHDLIADIVAVMSNLGFQTRSYEAPSTHRRWSGGEWEDFRDNDGDTIVQVKAYLNGNLHMRFKPDAIRALNVEAGRLLGWLRSAEEASEELGYPVDETRRLFGSSAQLVPSKVKSY